MQCSLSFFAFLTKPWRKTTVNVPRPCLLFFSFFALQKTMTSLPIHCCLLQLQKKKKNPTEDDKPSSLLSSFITQEKNLDVGFSWVVGDNNGPPGLSSCFNFFSSFAENNKSRGSLLFLGFIP